MKALGCEPAAVMEAIELGDPSLLYMEMSAAANHFGVARPSMRRDRKSGAKKRKQIDIELLRLSVRQEAYA